MKVPAKSRDSGGDKTLSGANGADGVAAAVIKEMLKESADERDDRTCICQPGSSPEETRPETEIAKQAM